MVTSRENYACPERDSNSRPVNPQCSGGIISLVYGTVRSDTIFVPQSAQCVGGKTIRNNCNKCNFSYLLLFKTKTNDNVVTTPGGHFQAAGSQIKISLKSVLPLQGIVPVTTIFIVRQVCGCLSPYICHQCCC